jgi:alpha-beta hydrolase superfamily lysophospholipase
MSQQPDFSILDRPEILQFIFHPRKESGRPIPPFAENLTIDTEDGHQVGARCYLTDPAMPHVLFFHGNGEIAEDYDDIGPVYVNFGLNFMVADFRGYGRSTGNPTIAAMFSDAHAVLDYFTEWMRQNQRTGPLWIMGRSLGSAPAIELAAARPDQIAGLVIESGFAHTHDLLMRLGINPEWIGLSNRAVFSNAEKLSCFAGPTLIIHGEYDQIIPLSHARDLHDRSPAARKKLHIIPNADHNSLMMVGGRTYFEIIRDFILHSDME